MKHPHDFVEGRSLEPRWKSAEMKILSFTSIHELKHIREREDELQPKEGEERSLCRQRWLVKEGVLDFGESAATVDM